MIEVNEYIRTNTGYIAKLEQYLSNTGTYLFDDFIQEIQGDKYRCISENELEKVTAKHSKQLIDLIEVGDFVNGMEILYIDDNKLYVEWNNEFEEFTGFLENKDIKTILTKESYMANCYKVGGEDE